jgi:thiamine transport system ATP-binding protein
MTIHTPEDVADLADQMAFVASGRVMASGSPSAILGGPLSESIAAATSDS